MNYVNVSKYSTEVNLRLFPGEVGKFEFGSEHV